MNVDVIVWTREEYAKLIRVPVEPTVNPTIHPNGNNAPKKPPGLTMNLSPGITLNPSPGLTMNPSPGITLNSSPGLTMNSSPGITLNPSPDPSPKPYPTPTYMRSLTIVYLHKGMKVDYSINSWIQTSLEYYINVPIRVSIDS